MLSTLQEISKYLEELDKNEVNTPVRLRSILKSVDSVNTCAYVHSFAMNLCNQLYKCNNIYAERICKDFINSEISKFNDIKQNGMVNYPDLLVLTKKCLSKYIERRLTSCEDVEKRSEDIKKSINRIHYKAIANKRNKQEDRYVAVANVVDYACNHRCDRNDDCILNRESSDRSILLVGLFDGHNGPEAAEHCHHLAPHLVSSCIQNSLCSKGRYNVIEILGETYRSLNNTLNGCRNKYRWKAGTTSTICLLEHDVLYTGWVGDCSAWMVYKDDAEVPLTDLVHRPTETSEVVDVWNNGGVVTKSGREYDRVNGILAVTRALGDDRKIVGVSALPSLSECRLGGRELCLVVASDGLWDSHDCSGRDIGRLCREVLVDGDCASIDLLCQTIVERAVRGGASDNVSVVVVVLAGLDHGVTDDNVQDARTVRWPRSRRRSLFEHELDRLRQCPAALDDYLQAHFGHSARMRPLLEHSRGLVQSNVAVRRRRARSLSQEGGARFSSPIRSIRRP